MARFLARRLAQGAIVIVGVTVIVFIATRIAGDPVDFILPLSASEEQRAARSAELGLDKPVVEQFFSYVGDVARFDLGTSTYYRNEPTLDVVFRVLPKSFQLIGAGMLMALLIAVPFGAIAAMRPGRILDRVLTTLSLIGLSTPQFFLGQLLIIVFVVNFKWVQTGPGPWTHVLLPAITLALPAIGRLAMVVRSSMIDELNTQYVKMAKAKGLRRSRIVGVHALRNAAIPFITLFGWEVIRALAGYTVVVESVFGWPGLGDAAITAVRQRDFYLLQTIVLVVAVMVVIINIAIDVIYKLVDPRVKLT